MDNRDFITRKVVRVIGLAFAGQKQLNRMVVVVDTESEKEEILSSIDYALKKEFPKNTVNVFRIDLTTIQSMSDLSLEVFHRIYDSQNENTKQEKDFNQWIVEVKKAAGVIGSFGMAPVISVNHREEKVNNGCGLFVFDNLDKANDGVLEGVKEMYHDGKNCLIPLGWEFISFCSHGAKIYDTRFAISSFTIDFNGD